MRKGNGYNGPHTRLGRDRGPSNGPTGAAGLTWCICCLAITGLMYMDHRESGWFGHDGPVATSPAPKRASRLPRTVCAAAHLQLQTLRTTKALQELISIGNYGQSIGAGKGRSYLPSEAFDDNAEPYKPWLTLTLPVLCAGYIQSWQRKTVRANAQSS